MDEQGGYKFGIWFSGTTLDGTSGGAFQIWGPSGATEGVGGFAPGQDVSVTLTWNAELGELYGTFEQGGQVERLARSENPIGLVSASGDLLAGNYFVDVEGQDRAGSVDGTTVLSIYDLTIEQS